MPENNTQQAENIDLEIEVDKAMKAGKVAMMRGIIEVFNEIKNNQTEYAIIITECGLRVTGLARLHTILGAIEVAKYKLCLNNTDEE